MENASTDYSNTAEYHKFSQSCSYKSLSLRHFCRTSIYKLMLQLRNK